MKKFFTENIDLFLFTETNISTPFVAQELTVLKKALHNERSERIRIQAAEMEKILKNLTPIHVPQPKDNRINELEKDLIKVKHVSWNLEKASKIMRKCSLCKLISIFLDLGLHHIFGKRFRNSTSKFRTYKYFKTVA